MNMLWKIFIMEKLKCERIEELKVKYVWSKQR